MHNNKVVLHGRKDPNARLWPVDFSVQELTPAASSGTSAPLVYNTIKLEMDADFVSFMHAALGSPTATTLIRALRNGFLGNLPRLTATMVSANAPLSMATAKGHLDLTRQGQRSTKPKVNLQTTGNKYADNTSDDDDNEEDEDEHTTDLNQNAANGFVRVIDLLPDNHTDLTGKFPCVSRKGNQYILVSVFNGYVHMEPMSTRHAAQYIKAFQRTIEFFRLRGHAPTHQRLDNETSKDLEKYLAKENLLLQYVAPNNHRANKAERAIRDAKNHLISMLSAAHPDFPLNLWDEMLPQAELTMNLLRPCATNKLLSAYEAIYGTKYDFLAHPIAPSGTKVLIFNSPNQRATFAPHGTPGYYMGPALDHYRCFHVFSSDTEAMRVADTLEWFPAPLKLPGSSPVEMIHAAIKDLEQAVTLAVKAKPRHHDASIQQVPAKATQALRDIAALFSGPDPHTPAQDQRVGEIPPPPGLPFPSALVPLQEEAPETPPSQQAGVEQRVLEPPVREMTARSSAPTQPPPELNPQTRPTRENQRVVAPTRTAEPTSHTSPSLPPAPTKQSNTTKRKTKGKGDRQRHPPRHNMTTRYRQHLHRLHNQPRPQAFLAAMAYAVNKTPSEPVAQAYAALNLSQDGKPLNYKSAKAGPDAEHWLAAEAEELCRLIDSGTIQAILSSVLPPDRRKDVTYYNPQTKEKTAADGSKTYRIRGTAGGDKINYEGDVSARTAEMEVIKTLIHSVVSDRANDIPANWITMDIKDYYLGAPLQRAEYVRIPTKYIPDAVMTKYALQTLVHNSAVLFQINKCMYGLPQAGLISQQRLVAHLAEHGYHQCEHVPCLFKHAQRGTAFTLVVDDFGVKYRRLEDADHLIETLRLLYEIKVDWTGRKYLGMTIIFNDEAQEATISMPEYIEKQLLRFCPNGKIIGATSPAVYVPPKFGKKANVDEDTQQQEVPEDTSPPLSTEQTKTLQEIVGVFLFYARAIDNTMLPAVNHIASLQSKPTRAVMDKAERLLAYAAAHPKHELVYHACDMILHIQSDASYHSRPEARSVAGGIHYLGNKNDPSTVNGAILAISNVISNVVASAAEAEYAACFINAQHGVWLRTILEALGYSQPRTTIICDNQCAVGLASDTVKARKSKAIDMRYHWIRDRVKQGQFEVIWKKGETNLADFFTKALPVHKHRELKPLLVRSPPDSENISLNSKARRSRAHRLSQSLNEQTVENSSFQD